MKKLFFIIIWLLITTSSVFAWVLNTTNTATETQTSKKTTEEWVSMLSWTWFDISDGWLIKDLWTWAVLIIIIYFIAITSKKTIQLSFEIRYAKNLRYLRVTLPRADSKLDKEKETKKDFKEKIWSMSMFYKAIHKLRTTSRSKLLKSYLGA